MTALVPLFDIHKILKRLPHRYPFLLVDRVIEFEKDKRIKALKNVSINEPFFTGHFPAEPVMLAALDGLFWRPPPSEALWSCHIEGRAITISVTAR